MWCCIRRFLICFVLFLLVGFIFSVFHVCISVCVLGFFFACVNRRGGGVERFCKAPPAFFAPHEDEENLSQNRTV